MRKSMRVGALSVTGVAAVIVLIASAALACTINMGGAIKFSSSPGGPVITSASGGSTAYSSADGLLSPDAKYVIRYVPLANRDDLCHNSPLALPGVFTTDSNGDWTDQSVLLPLVRGTYSMCAATPAASEPALDNPLLVSVSNWSNHLAFTIT